MTNHAAPIPMATNSRNLTPGKPLVAIGWTLALLCAVIDIIIIFVAMADASSYFASNTAGDIAVMQHITYGIAWAGVGVIGALLATSGHIINATAAIRGNRR